MAFTVLFASDLLQIYASSSAEIKVQSVGITETMQRTH